MIHYIMTWGENNFGRKLFYSPAGNEKAKYIVNKLRKIDKTRIVSFASGGLKFNGLYFPTYCIKENTWYCGTFGSSYSLIRIIERFFNIIQLYLYVIFAVNKDDIIIFYHERYFRQIIRFAKVILHRRIIIEIEELYCIAAAYSQKRIDYEIEGLKYADGYFLVNNILPEYIKHINDKPHCVIYGAYNNINIKYPKFNDGLIHILYSGTFNQTKGGALAAVQMASNLPEIYHVHITGFGSDYEVDYIKRAIEELDEVSKNKITFHGFISLNDLDKLMQVCHVGLCTQDPTKELNMTSFPSKILNYMSHGLVVLCGMNRAIKSSAVGDLIYYYREQTPEIMAKAVMEIKDFDGNQCLKRISNLDNIAFSEINSIIKSSYCRK